MECIVTMKLSHQLFLMLKKTAIYPDFFFKLEKYKAPSSSRGL